MVVIWLHQFITTFYVLSLVAFIFIYYLKKVSLAYSLQLKTIVVSYSSTYFLYMPFHLFAQKNEITIVFPHDRRAKSSTSQLHISFVKLTVYRAIFRLEGEVVLSEIFQKINEKRIKSFDILLLTSNVHHVSNKNTKKAY